MTTTNVTSKGQVTSPKPVRDYLGLRAGSPVRFERLASGDIVLRPATKAGRAAESTFARMRGRATVKMSTDEIMALMRGR
jgi:AbrB family looped-hinge helix DNA binding protein